MCYHSATQGLSFLRKPMKHDQEFLITAKQRHNHLSGAFISPTLCPFPCTFMAVSQGKSMTKYLLNAFISSWSHALIPFTFLVSNHFPSSVQHTHFFFFSPCKHLDLSILKCWWKCWTLTKWDFCIKSHYRHIVRVWRSSHKPVWCKKLSIQAQTKQMSGHGLVWSIMLLGVLFQEREVGGCEIPAKNGGIWAS